VIDIHNGGNNSLKNESSARKIPVHSQLVRAGLLRYRDSLRKGSLLFPGLSRRASKGNKIGARVGELFRKRLEGLGLKRDLLCFHSFRHTVSGRLDAAAVSQTDAARILGHGMSYGVYSTGPGLKRLAGVVEAIEYPGLKIPAAKRPRAGLGQTRREPVEAACRAPSPVKKTLYGLLWASAQNEGNSTIKIKGLQARKWRIEQWPICHFSGALGVVFLVSGRAAAACGLVSGLPGG
jgi:hypothetical protein